MGKWRATVVVVWVALLAGLVAAAIVNRPPDVTLFPDRDSPSARVAAEGVRKAGGSFLDVGSALAGKAVVISSGPLDGWTAGYTLAAAVGSLLVACGLILTFVWMRPLASGAER